MLIGLDFDNTIVCYGKAIEKLAGELLDLPSGVPLEKLSLRDFLIRANRESEWTSFQGALYGPGMAFATPFENALETTKELKALGHKLHIVSHRSCRPYAGPAYDLHSAARAWVDKWLICNGLIDHDSVVFCETRERKIEYIKMLQCNAFLDDLPEVIEDASFPEDCKAILFDPFGCHRDLAHCRIEEWTELPGLLMGLE